MTNSSKQQEEGQLLDIEPLLDTFSEQENQTVVDNSAFYSNYQRIADIMFLSFVLVIIIFIFSNILSSLNASYIITTNSSITVDFGETYNDNPVEQHQRHILPKSNESRSVFITGINGMIGSHLARELVQFRNEYIIYGLVRPNSNLYNLIDIKSHLHLLIGDITDSYRMMEIIETLQCPDYIYHFAAQSINGLSDHNSELTLRTNVDGTQHLLEALVQHKCKETIFIFASSSTVYGKSADTSPLPLTEDRDLLPVSIYGTSKVAGEALCTQYYNTYQLKTIRLRFFIQIGPGGTNSLSIQQFAQQIATLEKYPQKSNVLYHGNLDTQRDISDIRQITPFIIQLAERGTIGDVYNIGSGQSVNIYELLHQLISFSTINIILQQDISLKRYYDERILVANIDHLLHDLKINIIDYPVFNRNIILMDILNDWRHRLSITNSYSNPLFVSNVNSLSHQDNIPLTSMNVYKGRVPRFDLMVRTYWDSLYELLRMMLTYQIFWSYHEFKNQLIIIMDDESELDHQLTTLLEVAWKKLYRVKVYTEKMPKAGTLTAQPIGYYRSQYSNFYSDLYSDAEYIGIIDSDIQFFRRPNAEDLFENGKAILRFVPAHTQANDHWISTEWLIGHPYVGDFMLAFPVMIKREHFALMRTHIMNIHPEFDSFEGVWGEMHRLFSTHHGNFLIMGNYLFYYHYNEYEWKMEHYFDPPQTSGMVNSEQFLSVQPYMSKHIVFNYPEDKALTIERIYQNLCVTSNYIAGSCHRIAHREDIQLAAYSWLWTDYYPTIHSNPVDFKKNSAAAYNISSWKDRSRDVIMTNLQEYGGQTYWEQFQFQVEKRTYTTSFTLQDKIINATQYYSFPPPLPINK